MKILVDTHIWLWMNQAPNKLSKKCLRLLENTENQLFFSVAGVWELAIKHRLGKLSLPLDPSVYIPERMKDNDVLPLNIESHHVLATGSLPNHHQDPFDRLMISQAILENLSFMTVDEKIRKYDLQLIWGK